MLRKPIAVLLVVAGFCLSAQPVAPEASLELGMRAFRAGDYASARVDLDAAAMASAADLQTYVATGQMDRLHSFETALVYLALSQFRLGSEDDARMSITRLLEAERLAPVYVTLPLTATDASEFETLVVALVPEATLPKNGMPPPTGDATLPLPPVKPVAATAPVPPPVSLPVPEPMPEPQAPAAVSIDSAVVRDALNSLRQAEALADAGELRDANEIYVRLAAGAAREIVAAAAVGLYRTGAYRDANQAFRRLGALGRGEEDLHYYFAVSSYEAGDYETARRELLCALPYIELTDEVARYRIKIEQAIINQS
jgi:tetratricopeptide (TPR) repeat protein